MASDRIVGLSAFAGAAAAGGVVGAATARSTAYLPIPLAVTIADEPSAFGIACAAGFALPFAATLCRRAARARTGPSAGARQQFTAR